MQRGVYGVLEKSNRSVDSKPVIESHEYVPMRAPQGHWFDIHPYDVNKRLAEGWVYYDPPENHEEEKVVEEVKTVIPEAAKPLIWPYKNKHKGQTIYVMGCGPSLTPEIGKALMDSNAITIGVNDIFRLIPPENFVTTYHIHVDYVDDDKTQQFSVVNRPHLEKIQNAGSQLFIPVDFKLKPTSDLIGEYYFADPTLKEPPLDFDYEEGILRLACSSVSIYQAIQLAIIMGGSPIILLGVDFDIPKVGKGFGNMHFYDEYWDVKKRDTFEFKREQVKRLDKMRQEFEFRVNRDLMPELTKRGILILNGNPKSKVEIFPKVNIEGLLNVYK